MGDMRLRDLLEGENKDNLIKKMRIAGLKYSGLDKSTIIDILDVYLSDEDILQDIWNRLNPFERDYLTEYFKYDERPQYETLIELHEKHGLEMKFMSTKWDTQSPMNLIFFYDTVPMNVKKYFKQKLPPLVIKYDTLASLPLEEIHIQNIIGGDFFEDFKSVLQLAAIGSLEVTKATKYPTKKTIHRINDILSHKEFFLKEREMYTGETGIETIKKFKETNRIYGIYMILFSCSLLYVKGTKSLVSQKVESFLQESIEDKCKFLLQGYIKSHYIFEMDRIVESNYKVEVRRGMEACRKFIIKELKECPVGKWIKISQFLDYLKQKNKNFLINEVGGIIYFSEKHRIYLEPWVEWEEVEGRFIQVVLQEYLSVLGIVDTVIYESSGGCWDYDELPFFQVEFFRLTPLGAFVLGIDKNYHYEEKPKESGFTIENGNQIKIKNTEENLIHQLFFRDFSRKKESDQYSIYTLSFAAIANALEKGLTVKKILEYIHENSDNTLTADMKKTMLRWEEYLHKTTIENVTVVKTESQELFEAMQRDPTLKKYMLDDLGYAFAIDPNSTAKVKRRIKKITESYI